MICSIKRASWKRVKTESIIPPTFDERVGGFTPSAHWPIALPHISNDPGQRLWTGIAQYSRRTDDEGGCRRESQRIGKGAMAVKEKDTLLAA